MSNIKEDDGTDPLSLFNMIMNKDMEGYGSNWISRDLQPKRRRKTNPKQVLADAPINIDKTEFTLDPDMEVFDNEEDKKKKKKKKKVEEADQTGEPIEIETNAKDPNVVSSSPDYNVCPAFMMGVCRIDSKPCLFSSLDYKTCGKYYLASTGDPELFDISPGREQSPEYQFGVKS